MSRIATVTTRRPMWRGGRWFGPGATHVAEAEVGEAAFGRILAEPAFTLELREPAEPEPEPETAGGAQAAQPGDRPAGRPRKRRKEDEGSVAV